MCRAVGFGEIGRGRGIMHPLDIAALTRGGGQIMLTTLLSTYLPFQKCKRKNPPPSLLSNEISHFTPPKEDFSHPLGEVKGDLSVLRSDGGGTFSLTFLEST